MLLNYCLLTVRPPLFYDSRNLIVKNSTSVLLLSCRKAETHKNRPGTPRGGRIYPLPSHRKQGNNIPLQNQVFVVYFIYIFPFPV